MHFLKAVALTSGVFYRKKKNKKHWQVFQSAELSSDKLQNLYQPAHLANQATMKRVSDWDKHVVIVATNVQNVLEKHDVRADSL